MKKILAILVIGLFILMSLTTISAFGLTTRLIKEANNDDCCPYCGNLEGYIYGYSNMPDIKIKIELYLFDLVKNTTENVGTTYTDSRGFYEFSNLPCPGWYFFHLSVPSGYKVKAAYFNHMFLSSLFNCTYECNLTVRKSRSDTNLDNGKIYGYVLRRGSSLTWEVFPSVAVFLYDNPVGDPISSTTSSSDGYYEFTMLPYGTYIVKAEKDGYRCWPSTAIFLSEDNPESEWDFHMRVGKGEYMPKTIFHNVLEKILSFSLF